MQINLHFSQIEITQFLESRGYEIYEKTVSEWHQWGNHDRQGEWKDKIELYAKDNMGYEHPVNCAFQSEMNIHLKHILLHEYKTKR